MSLVLSRGPEVQGSGNIRSSVFVLGARVLQPFGRVIASRGRRGRRGGSRKYSYLYLALAHKLTYSHEHTTQHRHRKKSKNTKNVPHFQRKRNRAVAFRGPLFRSSLLTRLADYKNRVAKQNTTHTKKSTAAQKKKQISHIYTRAHNEKQERAKKTKYLVQNGATKKSTANTPNNPCTREKKHNKDLKKIQKTHTEQTKQKKNAHQEEEASRSQGTRGVLLRGVVNHRAVRPVA